MKSSFLTKYEPNILYATVDSQCIEYLGYILCQQVEKLFRKSVEFCNESDIWKLNVAHVLFMQENKFKEATGFYEPIVRKNFDNILNVSAIVLANLCVSYIMVRNISVIFSSFSLKTREKYISFAQFVYYLREVCLLFNL